MVKISFLFGVLLVAFGATAFADESRPTSDEKRATTKATFLITGLHCPPCTKVVESSLSKSKGIRSIKVDWKTKNARIEFDESIIPAQKVTQLIAATPHMMGSNMHYGGWLALKVPDLKNDTTSKQIKDVLGKVAGVKQVATYPSQHSVGIAFGAKGDLTSAHLIDVLTKAGIKAENL
jgi:copper chaperone CopZ